MASINCPQCGKELNEENKFCTHCGTALVKNNTELLFKTRMKDVPTPQPPSNRKLLIVGIIIGVSIIMRLLPFATWIYKPSYFIWELFIGLHFLAPLVFVISLIVLFCFLSKYTKQRKIYKAEMDEYNEYQAFIDREQDSELCERQRRMYLAKHPFTLAPCPYCGSRNTARKGNNSFYCNNCDKNF